MSVILKNQRGFSLVEVLVGLFLAGMIVLIVSNLPNAISLVTSSKSDTIVREVAAKKIEDARLAGFDNLSLDSTAAIVDPRLSSLNNVSAYMVTSACPSDVCPGGEEIKQITITISWNEGDTPKTYQIKTLVGKGGLK